MPRCMPRQLHPHRFRIKTTSPTIMIIRPLTQTPCLRLGRAVESSSYKMSLKISRMSAFTYCSLTKRRAYTIFMLFFSSKCSTCSSKSRQQIQVSFSLTSIYFPDFCRTSTHRLYTSHRCSVICIANIYTCQDFSRPFALLYQNSTRHRILIEMMS